MDTALLQRARPALANVLADRSVAGFRPYDGGPTVGALFESTEFFVANHVHGGISWVPANAAADRLLREPKTAALLEAIAKATRETGNMDNLRGVSFAGRDDARAALELIGGVELGTGTWPTNGRLLEEIAAVAHLQTDVAASHVKGWIDVAPSARGLLFDGVGGPDGRRAAAHILLHESMHVAPNQFGLALPSLEEGIAEALARWPGRLESFAAAARIEIQHGSLPPNMEYDFFATIVERALRLGGIDPDDPGDFIRAAALLRGRPIDEVPAAFEAAITLNTGDAALARAVSRTLGGQADEGDAALVEGKLFVQE